MDTGVVRSPKGRKLVGHDIQAKVQAHFQYITSYWCRVSSMGIKGIKKEAQWPGGAR